MSSSSRKSYGKWALVVIAIAYFFVFLSFIGWMIDWRMLYRIPQAIAAVLGVTFLILLMLFNHQLKMEIIEEAAAKPPQM